ncbi:hypothetical protein DDE82_008332 [Stemphylium lycopersici]|nr:hypothetical protein DDE82_008332 [Stemphylium lycopersici]
MAKAHRMSDMFTSSSEKDANTTTIAATPPYSSEGPTLPIIGASDDNTNHPKKRKARHGTSDVATKKPSQSPAPPTIHPSLYEPWTRLPPDLLKLLESHDRLRKTENIVPVVFSKNQNVKSGINRLKTYLGAYKDPASTIELPEALKMDDLVIAVSAQGEGTTKLVGIVDMARRIVSPSAKEQDDTGRVETWFMYNMLTSVDFERKTKVEEKKTQDTQEDDAFEPMDVDGHAVEGTSAEKTTLHMRKVPVLTVWLTKKRISAFKSAFGEQTFSVKKLPADED